MRRAAWAAGLATVVLVPLALALAAPGGSWQANTPLGALVGVQAAGAQSAATAVTPFQAYQEALGIVKREYYGDPIDAKKSRELTYAAVRGMLFSLNDPFTGFMDRDEWASMQQTTRGDFDGIGARLEPAGKDVRVMQAIAGTPAFRAGIKAGDIIYSVGTHDPRTGKLVRTTITLATDINEVVRLIKGPRGTYVTVSVLRKGQAKPIPFKIQRAHIEPPVVDYWMEDDRNKIGHIVLHEFNEKGPEQFDRAMASLRRQGMRALVFDLRYNPGGLLGVAVEIGSRFVKEGPVVIVQSRNGQREELQAEPGAASDPRVPMVVLVNGSSASASEIVAGAIQDNELGTVVGEPTFGKGLVQTLFELGDGSVALRLTTQKYFTSHGHDINNKYDDEHRLIPNTGGVKPDVVVKQSEKWTEQDFTDKANDTQLQRALDILRGRLASAR